MQRREYSLLHKMESTYWWHVGRTAIVDRVLARVLTVQHKLTILNVGGGTGGTVATLAKHGDVLNVDCDASAIRYLKRNGYHNVLRADGAEIPLEDASFDVVAALDVLEHMADDAAALAEWKRLLKPGGTLVVTVPAYNWLWSEHDELLHHFRRYTGGELQRLAEAAGFQIVQRSYAITFSFPLVVGYRFLARILRFRKQRTSYVALPKWLNELFISVLRLESRLLQIASFPFGTSVLLVAHKDCTYIASEKTYAAAASALR